MENLNLKSAFAEQIIDYLSYRERCELKNVKSEHQHFRKLDCFILAEEIKNTSFTREQAMKWRLKMDEESAIGRYKRINSTKHFFEYLFALGFDVFQFRDIKSPKSSFAAHIYTDDEVYRYFYAVDTYQSSLNRKNCIQLPVLFRILYCCGTRITETLMIRKKDVDLEAGIIKLSDTKNAKERYVVMSESLWTFMKSYADKTFYDIPDNGYIFRSYKGTVLSADWINELHVKILQQAGIPYIGGGHGPRVHDWRHSMATRSFKQMIDKGMDMYVSLPVLSAYLGHKSIMATERYLRLTVSMYPYIEQKFSRTLDEVFGKEDT